MSFPNIEFSVFIVKLEVFLTDLADNFAGNAVCYGICGDIVRYDTACPDDGIIADGDSRHDLTARTYPNISPDMDGEIVNIVMFTQNRQDGMPGGCKNHIRGDHRVIAYKDMLVIHKRDV